MTIDVKKYRANRCADPSDYVINGGSKKDESDIEMEMLDNSIDYATNATNATNKK